MATDDPHWSRARERGSTWGLRFTVWCFRRFGPPLSWPLIHAVVGYFFLTDRAGRAASRDYLERVRRRAADSGHALPASTPWQSFLHYREFALAITDRVALWSGQHQAYDFVFHGQDHLLKLKDEGQGAILLGAHLGSFDALRVLSLRDRVRVNVLMYTRHATRINAVFRELSPDVDVRVLEVDPRSPSRTPLEIKARIDAGEWVAILADRIEPGDRGRRCHVDFLGRPAPLPLSPFLLPVILGCPASGLVALRTAPRRYEIFAEPLWEPSPRPARGAGSREARAQELAAAYIDLLERNCVRAPGQWFNFYDFWAEPGPAQGASPPTAPGEAGS